MFSIRVRRLVLAAALASGLAATARAVPIRYDFSGEIVENYAEGPAAPWGDATTFTGSIIYDTDLPSHPNKVPSAELNYYTMGPSPSSGLVGSLTFQLGDVPSSYFGNAIDGRLGVGRLSDGDVFFVQETYSGSRDVDLLATISFLNEHRIQPGPLVSDAPPSGLSLPDFSNGSHFSIEGIDADGRLIHLGGRVTSLTPSDDIPKVPEPASVLVFAAVVIATAARARARGR
jgi:hypothetical protein